MDFSAYSVCWPFKNALQDVSHSHSGFSIFYLWRAAGGAFWLLHDPLYILSFSRLRKPKPPCFGLQKHLLKCLQVSSKATLFWCHKYGLKCLQVSSKISSGLTRALLAVLLAVITPPDVKRCRISVKCEGDVPRLVQISTLLITICSVSEELWTIKHIS